jgi:hypothetical protein
MIEWGSGFLGTPCAHPAAEKFSTQKKYLNFAEIFPSFIRSEGLKSKILIVNPSIGREQKRRGLNEQEDSGSIIMALFHPLSDFLFNLPWVK